MESILRVFLPTFLGDVEFEAARSSPILGVEVACCSIGMVHGAVQVIQNLFTGIPNPPEVRS